MCVRVKYACAIVMLISHKSTRLSFCFAPPPACESGLDNCCSCWAAQNRIASSLSACGQPQECIVFNLSGMPSSLRLESLPHIEEQPPRAVTDCSYEPLACPCPSCTLSHRSSPRRHAGPSIMPLPVERSQDAAAVTGSAPVRSSIHVAAAPRGVSIRCP